MTRLRKIVRPSFFRPALLVLSPKVTAPLLGGWITTLIVYSLDTWAHVSLPTIPAMALLGVVTFICGYLAPAAPPADSEPPPTAE